MVRTDEALHHFTELPNPAFVNLGTQAASLCPIIDLETSESLSW